jgi:probable rRNA maturation factor
MKTPEPQSPLELEVQYASDSSDVPDETALRDWARAALGEHGTPVELVIRIVDEAESRSLNHRYRGKDKPTNVLSFGFEAPVGVECNHLGDLVICAPLVRAEAVEQNKQPDHHWAHMVVHGVLHLRGYDHGDARQASEMETLEKQILQGFGIADPYTLADMAVRQVNHERRPNR